MPRRRRKEGFDYFVDKYEDSYNDYEEDNYFEERDQYIPGQDRFSKRNRYTGEIQSQRQFINTSSIYTGQPQGTIEFSAVPGLNGLDPYNRPLGTQTLMINPNNPYSAPNPYVQQILQTQQLQLDKQKEEMDSRFDELADKIDNLANVVEEKTQTLSFKNEEVQPATPVATQQTQVAPAPVATQQTQVAPAPAPMMQGQQTMQMMPPHQNTMMNTMQRPMPPMPTRTMQTPQLAPKKKKKISTGVLVGGIIGIIVAIGLIVVGVLLLTGVISF